MTSFQKSLPLRSYLIQYNTIQLNIYFLIFLTEYLIFDKSEKKTCQESDIPLE